MKEDICKLRVQLAQLAEKLKEINDKIDTIVKKMMLDEIENGKN